MGYADGILSMCSPGGANIAIARLRLWCVVMGRVPAADSKPRGNPWFGLAGG